MAHGCNVPFKVRGFPGDAACACILARGHTDGCSHQAHAPALAPRRLRAKDALSHVRVASHTASRCSLVHKAGPRTVSQTTGVAGGGLPQHAQRLCDFQLFSLCALPSRLFTYIPHGMRVVSINPPWVIKAASCRVHGPVTNSHNYLCSHELLQYELQKKSHSVPEGEKGH